MNSRMSQPRRGTDAAFLIAMQWRPEEEGVDCTAGVCVGGAQTATWKTSRWSKGGQADGAGESRAAGVRVLMVSDAHTCSVYGSVTQSADPRGDQELAAAPLPSARMAEYKQSVPRTKPRLQ